MAGTNGTNNNTSSGLGSGQRRVEDLIFNTLMARKELFKQLLDPRRNLADECGYPDVFGAEQYQKLYKRGAIPARVVEVYPKECWQVQPEVYEDEDEDVITDFEEDWQDLNKSLRNQGLPGEESLYEGDKGSLVWEYHRRMDILAGIGQYGIMLLGLDDGEDLSRPAKKKQGRKLLYLRCFPEALAPIVRFEGDPGSPRFGQPTAYNVTFNDPIEGQSSGLGLTTSTKEVHWSRVIHIADVSHQASSSEVFAVPRMEPVLDRLLDLNKLYGGSAEMYYRGAFPGYVLSTHPQLGGDVKVNESEVRDVMEQYMNGLQRYVSLMGMSMQGLSPQVSDPASQINVQIEAICVKIAIPIRIFKGSERGELASAQDDVAWNDRVKERHHGYLTPRQIVPFVTRLVALGVLRKPKQFYIYWPDLTSQSEQDKATLATTKTTAIVQYVQGGVEAIMPPLDFYTRIMGMEEDEATTILENAAEEAELAAEQQAAQQPPAAPAQPLPGEPLPAGAPPPAAAGTEQGGGGFTPTTQPRLAGEFVETGANPGVEIKGPPAVANVHQLLDDYITERRLRILGNQFCPTGSGGGVDPTCGKGGERREPTVKELMEGAKGNRAARKSYAKRTVAKIRELVESTDPDALADITGITPDEMRGLAGRLSDTAFALALEIAGEGRANLEEETTAAGPATDIALEVMASALEAANLLPEGLGQLAASVMVGATPKVINGVRKGIGWLRRKLSGGSGEETTENLLVLPSGWWDHTTV